jgi:hypothetical protein
MRYDPTPRGPVLRRPSLISQVRATATRAVTWIWQTLAQRPTSNQGVHLGLLALAVTAVGLIWVVAVAGYVLCVILRVLLWIFEFGPWQWGA